METTTTVPHATKVKYIITVLLFLVITLWFAYIHIYINSDFNARQLWGASYQIIALFGGVAGFFVAKKWGGYKSLIGKSIVFLSFSLLFQSFGQSVSSYYTFIEKINLPYPSIGDIGFFGSAICYIISAWLLMKASGLRFSLKSIKGKSLAIVVPICLIAFSYFFFLRTYQFDWSQPIKVFLDFGYPLGDTLYVSLAVIAFIVCHNFLGGLMKRPIKFLICALLFQFIADFAFLYQNQFGAWNVAGWNDYLFCFSYFLMTISILDFDRAYNQIKSLAH